MYPLWTIFSAKYPLTNAKYFWSKKNVIHSAVPSVSDLLNTDTFLNNYLFKDFWIDANFIFYFKNLTYPLEYLHVPPFENHWIRSSLDRGCMVYGSAASTSLQKCDRIQYQAMRFCVLLT